MKSALYTTHYRAGFTLVEIMVAMAIAALLAALAVTGYQRARKRAQATRTLEELRILDYAVHQYAIESGRRAGEPVTFADVKPYLKAGSLIYQTGRDCYLQAYGPFVVDTVPEVATLTFEELSDVAPSDFWAPYNPTTP
jgi:prepilin-type N-terminal cleavage/methylation domain-containing protein